MPESQGADLGVKAPKLMGYCFFGVAGGVSEAAISILSSCHSHPLAPLAIFARALARDASGEKSAEAGCTCEERIAQEGACSRISQANARRPASKKVASQKDTQTGDNTPADPGANTDAGGNNSTDGTTPRRTRRQRSAPTSPPCSATRILRLSLHSLSATLDPATLQKASDILPLVADQAEGLSVKGFRG